MASRRDQVQSYQFFVQRMTSALVAREPDPDAAPFRRLGGAGLGGIMIAVLCLAAVGVYGLVRPGGSTSWKDGAAVIVEKETGTRYVYRDGLLHPVLNYSSALLALGSPVTKQVSRNSLTGTARGSRIGIQDAPDALPDPKRMLDGPWTLCSQPASNAAGDLVATTVLTVGRRPTGGREPGEAALLARDDVTDVLYLVWHDHRHQPPRSNTRIVWSAALLVEAVGEGGGGGLVDDAEHLEAGDLARLLGGRALGVVEVGRHGDHGLRDGVAQVGLGVALQLLQRAGADLLGGVLLAVDLGGPARAHVALDGPDRAVGVGDRLALGHLADEDLAVLGEGDDRGRGAGALGVGDDRGSPASRTLTTELVVPRSMPTALAMGGRLRRAWWCRTWDEHKCSPADDSSHREVERVMLNLRRWPTSRSALPVDG